MGRIAKVDAECWLDEGLALLGEKGRSALTLQALVDRLAVTKGSFYHHFVDFGAFRTRMLDRFVHVSTLRHIEMAERILDPASEPGNVMDRLVSAAAKNDGAERILRGWALEDPEVRRSIERVDRIRLDYALELFLSLTGGDRPRSKAMARVLYALLVGAEQIDPGGQARVRRTVFAEFKRLYGL